MDWIVEELLFVDCDRVIVIVMMGGRGEKGGWMYVCTQVHRDRITCVHATLS